MYHRIEQLLYLRNRNDLFMTTLFTYILEISPSNCGPTLTVMVLLLISSSSLTCLSSRISVASLSAAAGPFSIDLGPAHILFPCTIIAIAAVVAAAVAVRIAGTAAESLAGREASLPSFACLQDSAHFRHSAEEQS